VARRMREAARDIFRHALEESSVERAFRRKVYYERGVLQVAEDLYDLGSFSRIFVVAVGKAAHSSLAALMAQLGTGLDVQGIVSAPTPPRSQLFGFRYFQGGHPLPNQESLRAADAARAVVAAAPEDVRVHAGIDTGRLLVRLGPTGTLTVAGDALARAAALATGRTGPGEAWATERAARHLVRRFVLEQGGGYGGQVRVVLR